MASSAPPRLAAWLLRHFGSSPNNAALIGDLDERYRSGRTRLWYWQQAVWAIAASFFKEISEHKALAIRALIIGWATKAAWFSAFWYVYGYRPMVLFYVLLEFIVPPVTSAGASVMHWQPFPPLVIYGWGPRCSRSSPESRNTWGSSTL
jgi:hypothetical protein